jgi:hypothetical protein
VSRRRVGIVPAILALALTLPACTTERPSGGPSREQPLTQTAQLALLSTPGEPLIDPAELVDGASYDGIPAVDDPHEVDVDVAAASLVESEQVMLVEHGGEARAYPLRSLIRHEIVNDVVGGRPVAVTWCPLCNTGIAFDRTVDGRPERFGVSGQLYRSALVMFDRTTGSLWPQPLGQAALGERTGSELQVVPSSLLPWSEVLMAHPDVTVVLGSPRELDATTNPYDGYDTSERPFLFRGEVDDRLGAFVRVTGVSFDGEARAWSQNWLRTRRLVQERVGGRDVVVFYALGTSSPLDSTDIRRGREIGSSAVYDPHVDGRRLDFRSSSPGRFVDEQTGSLWSLAGVALDGPLRGRRLTPLPHQDAFWFAWAAFNPDTSLQQ